MADILSSGSSDCPEKMCGSMRTDSFISNGEKLQESYGKEVMRDPGLAKDGIQLGADEYFVLGDNRNNSEDSRYANIGNIKKDYIIGKAWFRIAPFSEIGFL